MHTFLGYQVDAGHTLVNAPCCCRECGAERQADHVICDQPTEVTHALMMIGLELLEAIDPQEDDARFIVRPFGSNGGREFNTIEEIIAAYFK